MSELLMLLGLEPLPKQRVRGKRHRLEVQNDRGKVQSTVYNRGVAVARRAAIVKALQCAPMTKETLANKTDSNLNVITKALRRLQADGVVGSKVDKMGWIYFLRGVK